MPRQLKSYLKVLIESSREWLTERKRSDGLKKIEELMRSSKQAPPVFCDASIKAVTACLRMGYLYAS